MKKLIFKPVISEKSIQKVSSDKYCFGVSKNSNKITIKNEIKEKYKVDIIGVNVITKKGKAKNYKGRPSGKTKDWKLVIITVKKGQKIPGFEIAEDKK